MKIAISTVGSRGDIQPYLSLALELKKSGHQVKIITNDNFETWIKSYGLDFSPVRLDIKELLDSEVGTKILESGYSFKFVKMFSDMMAQYLELLFEDLEKGLEGSEFLLFSAVSSPAYQVAIKKGIKCMGAYLQPINPTNEFQSFMFPALDNLPFYNKLTHLILQQLSWQTVRTEINKFISEKLKLPKIGFWGNFSEIEKLKFPIIHGFSPYIVQKPLDWRKDLHVTGYWFLESQKEEKLSEDIENFLDTDKKVVYIGFGSMKNKDPEETANTVIKAIKRLDVRAIILTGWGGFKDLKITEDIHVVDSVPHDLLFPRVSAVVHHCGAGTTSAGLKAGVPTVPIPFFSDQPFWANLLYKKKLSSKPISRKDMNHTNLYNSINEAISNQEIIKNAKYAGKIIRSENGTKRAVDIINDLL